MHSGATEWKMLTLDDVVSISSGGTPPNSSGDIIVMGANGPIGFTGRSNFTNGYLVGRVGAAGAVQEATEACWASDNTLTVTLRSEDRVDHRFIGQLLRFLDPSRLATQTAQPLVTQTSLGRLSFACPPVAEQRRIAEILDTIDDQIYKTTQIVDKLRLTKAGYLHDTFPKLKGLAIQDGWTSSALREVVEIGSGSTPSRSRTDYWKRGTVPWVKTGEINLGRIWNTEERITNTAIADLGLRRYPVGTILIAMYGQGATRGRVAMLETEACINQACAALRGRAGRVDQNYLFHLLSSQYEELRSLGQGSNQTNLSADLLSTYRVPFPTSLGGQARIGAQLSAFESMIEKEDLARAKLVEMKAGLAADLLSGRVRVPQESLS